MNRFRIFFPTKLKIWTISRHLIGLSAHGCFKQDDLMYFPRPVKYLWGFSLNAADWTHLLCCLAWHLKHIPVLSQAISRVWLDVFPNNLRNPDECLGTNWQLLKDMHSTNFSCLFLSHNLHSAFMETWQWFRIGVISFKSLFFFFFFTRYIS